MKSNLNFFFTQIGEVKTRESKKGNIREKAYRIK
jgi:hypothetical protein